VISLTCVTTPKQPEQYDDLVQNLLSIWKHEKAWTLAVDYCTQQLHCTQRAPKAQWTCKPASQPACNPPAIPVLLSLNMFASILVFCAILLSSFPSQSDVYWKQKKAEQFQYLSKQTNSRQIGKIHNSAYYHSCINTRTESRRPKSNQGDKN